MKKILLIITYFGEFPNYFDLFLKSCEYNDTIDWLIVTDNDYNTNVDNVKIVNSTLSELSEIIQVKLGSSEKILEPYKLCEYKPAYGVIFSEYIDKYDFWGHSDIDMIFGDLRKYLTDDLLNKYNKIFQFGHLTLFRNEPEVNNYFLLESTDAIKFSDAIKKNEVMYFDEIGINKILDSKGISQYKGKHFADILPQYPKFKIRLFLNDENEKNQRFFWSNGKVYKEYLKGKDFIKREYIYIHLQKRNFPMHNFDIENMVFFYITPFGFKSSETQNIYKYYKNNWNHFLKYHYRRYSSISVEKIKRKLSNKYKY